MAHENCILTFRIGYDQQNGLQLLCFLEYIYTTKNIADAESQATKIIRHFN